MADVIAKIEWLGYFTLAGNKITTAADGPAIAVLAGHARHELFQTDIDSRVLNTGPFIKPQGITTSGGIRTLTGTLHRGPSDTDGVPSAWKCVSALVFGNDVTRKFERIAPIAEGRERRAEPAIPPAMILRRAL